MNLAQEALQFLRTTQSGVLSTFSAKFEGFPFGSVAPFVLNHAGEPVILISSIAEHTKNILANPKVSLLVFAGMEDLQANARLTLLGEAVLADKEDTNLRSRYLRYFPQAETYFDMHDFHFYRIKIAQVRYIAGFGKMGWISEENFSIISVNTEISKQEAEIVNHMNTDHQHSLIAYTQHFHSITPKGAKMLGIDRDGFDVKIQLDNGEKIVRFNFETPIHDATTARAALVAMSKIAKP